MAVSCAKTVWTSDAARIRMLGGRGLDQKMANLFLFSYFSCMGHLQTAVVGLAELKEPPFVTAAQSPLQH